MAEKVQMPVGVENRTPAGHSSQPVPHTGIGIMSEIVVGLERLHYSTYFSGGHPMLSFLACT